MGQRGAYIYCMQRLEIIDCFLIVGPKEYPAGIYGYRLMVDGAVLGSKRMILLK